MNEFDFGSDGGLYDEFGGLCFQASGATPPDAAEASAPTRRQLNVECTACKQQLPLAQWNGHGAVCPANPAVAAQAASAPRRANTLPEDSTERKEIPLYSGPMRYFPAALAGVARVCKRGNDKHNPGEPMHHARAKSNDHPDCISRHLVDMSEGDGRDRDGTPHVDNLAWRALALAQEWHEKYDRAPFAPGSRNATRDPACLRGFYGEVPYLEFLQMVAGVDADRAFVCGPEAVAQALARPGHAAAPEPSKPAPRPALIASAVISREVRDGTPHGTVRLYFVARRRDTVRPALDRKWEFPGGHVEASELPELACERETLEETHLHVDTGRLLRLIPVTTEAIDGTRAYVITYFACRYRGGHVVLEERAFSEFAWVTFDELDKLDLIPSARTLVDWARATGDDLGHRLV